MNKSLEDRYNTDKRFKSATDKITEIINSGLSNDDIVQAWTLAELKIAERKAKVENGKI